MALDRATPILTTKDQVVDLTGVEDQANLEAGGEFAVADVLLRAHEWVFDRLEQRFGAEAVVTITNTTRLERAVAARYLELAIASGKLADADPEQRDYWGREARSEVGDFHPAFSSDHDAPRASAEGVPRVANLNFRTGDTGPLFKLG